jgi:hypothetical protein
MKKLNVQQFGLIGPGVRRMPGLKETLPEGRRATANLRVCGK